MKRGEKKEGLTLLPFFLEGGERERRGGEGGGGEKGLYPEEPLTPVFHG